MKLAWLTALFCAAAILLALPFAASPSSPPSGKDGLPEVNVVLRISRKLVNELTTKKIQRTTPIYLHDAKAETSGHSFTDATSSVQFPTAAAQATAFVIVLEGATVSQTVTRRPPIAVFGSGRMVFTVRKRVTFDGERFRTQPTSIDASFCSSVDGIATPPGIVGLFVRLIATPRVHREAPLFADAAFRDGKAQLVATFDEEVDRIINDLNQVSPLEETVTKLFPETRDWIYYPLTTPTHLLIGVGPRNYRVPELPVTAATDAPIELWIRNKPETQGMLQVLKLWKDASKQLDQMLPATLGKSLKFEGGFNTRTVKDWFVIQLGQPRKPRLEEEPSVPGAIMARESGGADRPLFAQDRCEAPAADGAVVWRPLRQPDGGVGGAQALPLGVAADDATRITVMWRPITTTPAVGATGPTSKAAP
jgi:hypothetical protein